MHLRRQLAALVLGAATTIILGTARGQVPGPTASSPQPAKAATSVKAQAKPAALPDLPDNVFADPSGAPGRPGTPDPAEAKKQEHLQKIRQLAFDRRPSAILKAWSTPRDEAIKEAENPSAQSPMQGQANPAMLRAMRPRRPACPSPCPTRRPRSSREPRPAAPRQTRSIAISGGSSTT